MNTASEWRNAFNLYYNNIMSDVAPSLNDYEISVFLTDAQNQIVDSIYSGQLTFEGTEKSRRYLDKLTEDYYGTINEALTDDNKLSDTMGLKHFLYTIPTDIKYIVFEQVVFDDETLKCYNGQTASVVPVTHDEYMSVSANPFRGPTKYKVMRLDANDCVELVSKYEISKYHIRYIRRPQPIILSDLSDYNVSIEGVSSQSDCELDKNLHNLILETAVNMAKSAYKG